MMMDHLHILQIDPSQLQEYAVIPIAYEVNKYLRVEPINNGLGGLKFVEEPLPSPYVKDYDCIGGKDTGPNTWAQQFDLKNWGIFLAIAMGETIGGAVVATRTSEVNMLENRENLAVLWDIRVHPAWRQNGIGRALFKRAVTWASKAGCIQLKIETQNNNLPACHFYARMGCKLGMVHCYGYAGTPEVSEEAMLFWYYDL